MSDAYDRVQFRGVTVNKRTRAMIWEAERRLGFRFDLLQGSYHRGVDLSAQTHWGGGCVDLYHSGSEANWRRAVRKLRDIGFAAWHRTPDQGFDVHIHAVAIGDRDLSPGPYGAAVQVDDYFAGGDGLAGNLPDPQSYRPSPPVRFNYPEWQRKNRLRNVVRSLSEQIHRLRRRRSKAVQTLKKLS